jgi:hypothetical protein
MLGWHSAYPLRAALVCPSPTQSFDCFSISLLWLFLAVSFFVESGNMTVGMNKAKRRGSTGLFSKLRRDNYEHFIPYKAKDWLVASSIKCLAVE